MPKVTTATIAKQLGLSQPVVGKVLNGGKSNIRVADATRRRIERKAEELGYRPNAAARSTRTGKFGSVALLLGTRGTHSTLSDGMLNGIQDALDAQDLNLVVVRMPDQKLTDEQVVPRILRETASDGLLVDYTHDIPQPLIDLLADYDIPSVWLNTQREQDAVYPDDLAGAVELTNHLLSLGHRRIAYLDVTSDRYARAQHYSSLDRRRGFEQAMSDAGLEPTVHKVLVHESLPGPKRYEMAMRVLNQPDRPTALICYGDSEFNTFSYAAAKLGIDIPNELSIATYRTSQNASLGISLTAMLVPDAEVGKRGVAMLLQKIADQKQSIPSQPVPLRLALGETTQAPLARDASH